MKPEDCKRVHINACVRDEELEAFDKLAEDAEPGEWYLRNGKITRFQGQPVEAERSLLLMVAARSGIPRLVRGIRALESTLKSAWVAYATLDRTNRELAEESAKALERCKRGETGPDGDIPLLVEARKFGILNDSQLEYHLRRWARGERVPDHLLPWVLEARTRVERITEANEKALSDALSSVPDGFLD